MTDTTTTEPKYRTITLTDARPVRIREDHWPVLAQGAWRDHDGQVRVQANRAWDLVIKVRQHSNGRALVYGFYEYDTHFQGEQNVVARVGVKLAAGADLPSWINAVAEMMRDRLRDYSDKDGFGYNHITEVAAECIADLPPEDLT